MSSRAPCIRCASTPQPDCTATYCTPSTAKELGTPVMPEFVRHCQSGSPVLPSNARKYRSLVPPAKTSPLPVVKIGPQLCDSNEIGRASCRERGEETGRGGGVNEKGE